MVHFLQGSCVKSLKEILKEALSYHQQGNFDKAEAAYRCILNEQPDNADALHLLGLIEYQRGNDNSAIGLIARAVFFSPERPVYHFNLANIYAAGNKASEALSHYRTVVELDPRNADAFFRMGNMYRKKGLFSNALSCYRSAVAIRPDFIEAINNIGAAHKILGMYPQAVSWFKKAAELQPHNAECRNNLGMAFVDCGRTEEAITCFRTALHLKPTLVPAYVNLGKELMLQGNLDDALECFNRAVKYNPDHYIAHDNLLICKNYMPSHSPPELYSEHLLWTHSHAVKIRGEFKAKQKPASSRRLRIGYISPDFYHHPVANFMIPVLRNHNHVQFEVFCYSDVKIQDRITHNLKGYADTWRDTISLSDQELTSLITDDGIHILIDLTGHLANNRLLTFARKPAPLQISYLGYPCTTGLSEIDYYLTDEIADPAGQEENYTEDLVRLENCFCCYEPSVEAPGIGPLPAKNAGFVTFGSLHNLARLNSDILELWSRVLHETPSSRLLIFRTNMTSATAKRLQAFFTRRGIENNRIRPVDSCDGNYLSMYNKIDIALDTFPWSGHTTACEALWMGVPVITLTGDRHAGRMVSSVVSSLGMSFLAAESKDQYVAKAKQLSENIGNLEEIRRSLRERMSKSLLCDGIQFTGNFEKTLLSLWGKQQSDYRTGLR
ncbi:MAG: tetratricopeptide repeat protein [Chitinivibrionales bacterium]|nr:tetratricopeptide repeat protein [Chitinivibrionales bacterium]